MLIVIGLGNYLRGDDGIGPVIIQKLQEYPKSLQIKLVDAGSDAFGSGTYNRLCPNG